MKRNARKIWNGGRAHENVLINEYRKDRKHRPKCQNLQNNSTETKSLDINFENEYIIQIEIQTPWNLWDVVLKWVTKLPY